MIFFFLLTLFSIHYSIQCHSGSSSNLSVCDTLPGEECISGLISTPLYLNGSFAVSQASTMFYSCGNYSLINSTYGPYINNVQKCNTTLCQTPVSPTNATGCDAISNQTECIGRTDCFWCNNAMGSGVGICSRLDVYSLPCFTLADFFPQPICGSIMCPPPSKPYNSSITIDEIYNFTFPIGQKLSGSRAVKVALEVATSEIIIMDTAGANCELDNELQTLCANPGTQQYFAYCVVAEEWPQTDINGWLANTVTIPITRDRDGFAPLIPSLCVCETPGRAYYLHLDRHLLEPHFKAPCKNEHALLALYILLMLITTVVFILVIWDTALLFYYSCISIKKGAPHRGSKITLYVKIVMIVYFLVILPAMALWLGPFNANGPQQVAAIFLRVTGWIMVLLAYSLSVFTYLEIVLDGGVMGSYKLLIKFLGVFKWFFILFDILFLLATLGVISTATYYITILFGGQAPLLEILPINDQYRVLIRTTFLMLICFEGLVLIITGVLLFFLGVVFYKNSSKEGISGKHFKIVVVRYVGLIVALFCSILHLTLFCAIAIILSWFREVHLTEEKSPYSANVIMEWLIWSQFVTEICWISSVAYAMRTAASSSWIYYQLKSVLGLKTQADGAISAGDADSKF